MSCEECGSPFEGSHFGDCRVACGMKPPRPVFQHYWRCAHYPSSIKNFFDGRTECEWECHTQELKWYHGGMHPMPKSWPAVRDVDRAFK